MFWGSQSQGSDSGRLEMKQKHFASKREKLNSA
ncbi:hypothetical protein phi20c_001 [Streptococcus phage phi20c]|nr:hypothetical protein phi20c_001 [Streptococcus phage phi20c]